MANQIENPEFRRMLAERMQALANPTRIHMLHLLMQQERRVSELIEEVGISQASVSKHISILYRHGFVGQRKVGTQTFYFIANEGLKEFCNYFCEDLKAHLQKVGELGKEVT